VRFSNDFKKRIEEALKVMTPKDGKKLQLPSSREELRSEINALVLQNVGGEANHFLS
jgi:hypothetical protein